MKCKNCQEIQNGSIIKIDKNKNCVFCGRNIYSFYIQKQKTYKITIGKNAYKNRNDYFGMTGTVMFCDCCKENRVQFDNIANNESLSNFDILKCNIFVE